MKNPNNLIGVNFPNGQSRKRNCQSTVKPEERRPVPRKYPAVADLYAKAGRAIAENNVLRSEIEVEYDKASFKIFIANTAIIFFTTVLMFLIASLWYQCMN